MALKRADLSPWDRLWVRVALVALRLMSGPAAVDLHLKMAAAYRERGRP